MKTPVYTRYEYVDATAFSLAASQLVGNVGLLGDAAVIGGLFNNDSMTTSSSGLVLTVNLPAPFGIINNAGAVAQAHGTVTNQDTSTYTVNFASFVPGTGSQTVYLIATLGTINQDPYQVVGPPNGHPSYVANFVPFTAYATTVDTLTVSATLTPPNNTTNFELGRFTLATGAVSLPTLNTTFQILAAPLPIMNIVSVTSNTALTVANAGVGQRADVANLTFTLPDAGVANAYEFTIIARAGPTTLQRSTSGNLIYGVGNDPSAGATSVVIPQGCSVTVASDGTAYQATASNEPIGTTNLVNVAVGGSNITLTAAQAAADIIQLTGTLTANILLLFPVVSGTWVINRITTGAFTITAEITGLPTFNVPLQNGTNFVTSNANGIFYASANCVTQAPGNATNLNASCAFVQNQFAAQTFVNSFNTRTGAVTLTSADVTTALTYTPVNNGSGSIIGTTVQLTIDGVPGNFRRFGSTTSGVNRWFWGATSSTESGGNTGSNWTLTSYDDSGNALVNVLVFSRATGIGNFAAIPTMPTAFAGDVSLNGSNTTFVSTAIAQSGYSKNSHIVSAAGTTNFVVPAGITAIYAECQAGGGAGGGSASTYNGGAGGAGGFAGAWLTVTPGSTLVLVNGAGGAVHTTNGGAGGTSSISVSGGGTLLSATGGSGGQGGASTISGGFGGTGSFGDVNYIGGSGTDGTTFPSSLGTGGFWTGVGGASFYGGGCRSGTAAGSASGAPGSGGGASYANSSATNGQPGNIGQIYLKW